MNSDNIQDEISENNLSNKKNKDQNFISYLSDIFLGKNDENDNNKTYDDFQEDLEESYENLINLSKMDMSKIYEHFEINNNSDYIDNQKQNSYNKKYSNILINTNNYEIDYELQINDNETITFLKSKK
jgi:hypothetical protein